MNELPRIDLVVAVIGDERVCVKGKRPYILIHLDGRVYRAAMNEALTPYENGEVVSFHTEGNDEPYAPTLRYFDAIDFVGEAEGTDIEPLWKQIVARAG